MNEWDFLTSTITRPVITLRTPLLWVAPDAICFGNSAVISPIRAEHITWLRGADGTRTSREFIECRPCADASIDAVSVQLARAALAAGVLDDAAFSNDHWRWGDDRQRRECNRLFPLIQQQWSSSNLTVPDMQEAIAGAIDSRLATTVALDPCEPLLAPLTSALASVGIRVVSPHDPYTLMIGITRGHPALYSEPDYSPLKTPSHNSRHHTPYLHVGMGATEAQVGPLVAPGSTACLRCAHLHERDRDTTWPLRSVQWADHARRLRASLQTPMTVDPTVELHALALITHLVRMWVDDAAIDTTDHWADVVHRTDGITVRTSHLVSHPQCGCDWQAEAA